MSGNYQPGYFNAGPSSSGSSASASASSFSMNGNCKNSHNSLKLKENIKKLQHFTKVQLQPPCLMLQNGRNFVQKFKCCVIKMSKNSSAPNEC